MTPPAPPARALALALLLLAPAAPAHAAPPAGAKHRRVAPAPARPDTPSARVPGAPDPWHVARALADEGRPDSALAVVRAALRRDPASFELRWFEAGLVGETGDHAAAVRLYEELSASLPARAPDLLADLGRERQRSGAFMAAIHAYRRWLDAHPEDREVRHRVARSWSEADSLRQALAAYDTLLALEPGDTEAALARAQVLGWMGRHGEAIRAYGRIVARDSSNVEARTGLAMNENWSGRHRRAAARLEELLREPGADPGLRKTLAYARYWDGDPDAARRALEPYVASVPDDSEAWRLLRRIRRDRRPRVSLAFGRSDDSDGLRVDTPEVSLTWGPWEGATGMLGWRRDEARDAGGALRVPRSSAGLEQRFGSRWNVYGRSSWTDWASGPGLAPGGEFGVVHRPLERWRFEAVVAREPVATRRSLSLGITRLDWAGAVDVTATDRLRLHADGRVGSYSDGNGMERTAASVRYRAWSSGHAEASLGLSGEQLNTHRDLDHGYYDPDFHTEWGPRIELTWSPDDAWMLGTGLRYGWQREKGSAAEPYYNVSARAEWSPDPAWSLAAEAGRGDSNLQSAGGYERRWWQLTLARSF